jgi:hypothetical protein
MSDHWASTIALNVLPRVLQWFHIVCKAFKDLQRLHRIEVVNPIFAILEVALPTKSIFSTTSTYTLPGTGERSRHVPAGLCNTCYYLVYAITPQRGWHKPVQERLASCFTFRNVVWWHRVFFSYFYSSLCCWPLNLHVVRAVRYYHIKYAGQVEPIHLS